MRRFLSGIALGASLFTAACGYARPPEPGAVLAPAGARSGPACRVFDEDMFGRRYCRVRYVYPGGS